MCVAAVLGDARVSVLGGREDMPRSLGSVYSGSVTRFLGGIQGIVSRVIDTPDKVGARSFIAVSRDGSSLLVHGRGSLHQLRTSDGSVLRRFSRAGDPLQAWIADDDLVFISDRSGGRVRVLTPNLLPPQRRRRRSSAQFCWCVCQRRRRRRVRVLGPPHRCVQPR